MAVTKFPCPDCDKTFSRKADVSRHVDNMHRQLRGFQCRHPGCERSFPQKSHEKQHYAAIHDKGSLRYQCEGCGRVFNDPSSRKRHLKSPTACRGAGAPEHDTAAQNLQRSDATDERQPPSLPAIPSPAVVAAGVGSLAPANANFELQALGPTDIDPWFLDSMAANLNFPCWAGSSPVGAAADLGPQPQLATPPLSEAEGDDVDGDFEVDSDFDFGFGFDQLVEPSVHQDMAPNVGLQLPAPFALEDVPGYNGGNWMDAAIAPTVR